MAVFTASEALDIAMRLERNGQAFYEATARKIEDAEVKELLLTLAGWEQRHYETFQKLADRLKLGEPPLLSGPYWQEYELYIQAALGSAMFYGPDKAAAMADQVESVEQALRMALGLEKDSLLFYYDLREMMPEAERGAVDEIIREEKGHATRLARLLRGAETTL